VKLIHRITDQSPSRYESRGRHDAANDRPERGEPSSPDHGDP
jgi:hypothetical protein